MLLGSHSFFRLIQRWAAKVNAMHLELIRDKSRAFPSVEEGDKLTSITIWHCAYNDLSPVGGLLNLTRIKVAGYPNDNLNCISQLPNLEYLSLLHLPNITDLSPIGACKKLRVLRLHTLPSWDSSGKRTFVDSLAPIAGLPQLQDLELFGVCPITKDPSELAKSRSLERVRLSKYLKKKVDAYYSETGVGSDFARWPE